MTTPVRGLSVSPQYDLNSAIAFAKENKLLGEASREEHPELNAYYEIMTVCPSSGRF